MAGSSHHVVHDLTRFGRPFWLPPGGWGNGLEDTAWAAVVDVNGEHAASVILMRLREAHVPGYAAGLRPALRTRRGSRPSARPVRIWVGAASYGRGQSAVLEMLPDLVGRFGPGVLRG